jgi:hypothetical protein
MVRERPLVNLACGSASRPAEVHDEGSAGEGPSRRAEQQRRHLGHLLGLEEALDRVRAQDDVLEDYLLGQAVGLRVVGDLLLDERRAHEGGTDRRGRDALLGAFEGQDLDEAQDAVLKEIFKANLALQKLDGAARKPEPLAALPQARSA